MTEKLKLESLKVKSFTTTIRPDQQMTIAGGFTGNCLSFINITCPEPCDFQSIPLDECGPYNPTQTEPIGICSCDGICQPPEL